MSKQKKNSRVLRDLIRIGVFSALLLVVQFIIACTIGYVPFLMLTVMPCILSCVTAIIYIVMHSKLTISGGFLIPSILFGLCMINMSPYGFNFFTSVIGGILAEVVYHIIGKGTIKGQTCITGGIGQYIPFIWMQDAYLKLYADNSSGTLPIVKYSIEHITIPFAFIMTVIGVGFTLLGCLWGKKIVNRHFKKN